MADAVLSFLVENLLQIISENVKLIAGAKGELELLVEEVKTLNAFLDEAAKTQSDNKLWKQFIKDIRITVYKAEDIIDKFLVQAKLHADKNIVKRGFDYNYAGAVKELGEQVGIVLQKVKKLREDNKQAFQPTPVSARQGETSTQGQETQVRQKCSYFENLSCKYKLFSLFMMIYFQKQSMFQVMWRSLTHTVFKRK